jgi:hypothetical protein
MSVSISITGRIGTVTMDHRRVNPLSSSLLSDLSAAFDELAKAEVRAVILRAPKAPASFLPRTTSTTSPPMAVTRLRTTILSGRSFAR